MTSTYICTLHAAMHQTMPNMMSTKQNISQRWIQTTPNTMRTKQNTSAKPNFIELWGSASLSVSRNVRTNANNSS